MTRVSTEGIQKSALSDKGTARIRREIEQNLAYFQAHPEEIDIRLDELDREPSLETLLAGATSVGTLLGFALGVTRARLWYALPVAVHAMLAWHIVRGTSPGATLLRSLGVRSRKEIAEERFALKVLRGDVGDPPVDSGDGRMNGARKLAEAVRR